MKFIIKLLSVALLAMPGLHALQKHEARDIAEQIIHQAIQELFQGITKGNLAQIQDALKLGASANHNYTTNLQLDQYVFKQIHRTPLTLAVSNKNALDIARLLVQHGANVNKPDGEGDLPLHMAIFSNKDHLVDFFIQQHANVNKKDGHNRTPLYQAINGGNIELTTKLLIAGADINLPGGPHNITPLIQAIDKANSKIVQLLLGQGADITGAYQYAAQYGSLEIAGIIRRYEQQIAQSK